MAPARHPTTSGTAITRYRDWRKKRPAAVGMLVEGDSWFNFPMWKSTNLTQELKNYYDDRIVQLPASRCGDDIREMLSGQQFAYLYRVMAEEKLSFDSILFSGGGNDIAGPNLPGLLRAYEAGMTWEDCLNMPRFGRRLDEIQNAYLTLGDLREDHQPDAWVFTHGYDFATPSGRGFKVLGLTVAGKWIKKRMDDRGIPEGFQKRILGHMLAEFDNRLIALAQQMPRWVHVRTQGTLKDSDWADELHPSRAGFQKIAGKFKGALGGVFPQLA